MNAMVNVVLFQLGWFASVWGAAKQLPWLGVSVVAIVVSLHLAFRGKPNEVSLIAASAVMGVAFDTVFLHTGIVVYQASTAPEWLAPWWIVAMWANFAITLRHSVAWLSGRWVATAVLGALGGPLAYWGASNLGAVRLPSPPLAAAVLAASWGAAVSALFWMSRRMEESPA